MKMTQLKKLLSLLLCMVLIAATALFTIGCSDGSNEGDGGSEGGKIEQPSVNDNAESGDETEAEGGKSDGTTAETGVKELGEGAKSFDFTVVDLEGNETKFLIKTDKEVVGDALLELKLIEGEAGPYGLYVKKVNGITADYDKDKTYWGFYVDGEYAMTGVDMTKIEEGKTYTFKVSK